MKSRFRLGLRIILLPVLLYAIFTVASLGSGLGSTSLDNGAEAAVPLLFICLAISLAASYPVLRSRWTGWQLILSMFWVVFGIMTLLTQIETVVFLDHLVEIIPSEIIPKLFIQGFIVAALFAPLLVVVCGKYRPSREGMPRAQYYLPRTGTEWFWRVALIALIYILVYISFGLFVFKPLAGEGFAHYYSGLQMPGWILPFQAVRALIWVSIATPVIQMMRGKWWEAALAVALLFSVLMGFQLILPNDFMPGRIRFAHFIEVTTSNFIFGWLVVWILVRWRRR